MIARSAGRRTEVLLFSRQLRKGHRCLDHRPTLHLRLGAAVRRSDRRTPCPVAHRNVRSASVLVRVVSVRPAAPSYPAREDRSAGRGDGHLIVVTRSWHRTPRSLPRPHLGPLRPGSRVADNRSRLLTVEPRRSDLDGRPGRRADRRRHDRRERRNRDLVERGSVGRARLGSTNRSDRGRTHRHAKPPTHRRTTPASESATRRPRVMTQARVRDAESDFGGTRLAHSRADEPVRDAARSRRRCNARTPSCAVDARDRHRRARCNSRRIGAPALVTLIILSLRERLPALRYGLQPRTARRTSSR